jgi:hypothetical protein
MSETLGSGWHPTVLGKSLGDSLVEDKKNEITYNLQNLANTHFTVSITVSPKVVDNHLIIEMKKWRQVLSRVSFDLDKGVDWPFYRKTVQDVFKSEVEENLRKLLG